MCEKETYHGDLFLNFKMIIVIKIKEIKEWLLKLQQ